MFDKILALFGKANNKTLIIVGGFIVAILFLIGYFCPDGLKELIGLVTK